MSHAQWEAPPASQLASHSAILTSPAMQASHCDSPPRYRCLRKMRSQRGFPSSTRHKRAAIPLGRDRPGHQPCLWTTDVSDTSEPIIRSECKAQVHLTSSEAQREIVVQSIASGAVLHLLRAKKMTGRPRATRQIDLQVIDQVDGLRAAVNEMASFLQSEELGDLAARAAVLFAATLSALQQASVTVESGLREVKMSSGKFRFKVVSVPHSSLKAGILAARETIPAAAILRQHLGLQSRRSEQPLPFQSAKSKQLQVAVKPGTPISYKGKNTLSVFWDRLRSVETAEKLAERGRVTVFESYYALAQAYQQINHQFAVTKLSLDHQQFHSVTFHHLRAPAFNDAASQKATRSAVAPDNSNNLKNLAALKKRLERARKIGALAELFGLQAISGSRLTIERVDQIAFSLIRAARAGQKGTETAESEHMESDHDMHESA
ncbi:hypothetical protein U1Q18_044778 [Sarracenia purpurea var. burkii]